MFLVHPYKNIDKFLELNWQHADLNTARNLLGPEAIIGVTCSSQEQAFAAISGGADYLGIGTMYATPT